MARFRSTTLAAAIAATVLWSSPTVSQVSVQNNVLDEGQSCYKVTTPSATYWYQKEGCGFSSIEDKQGNDWVSYDDDYPNSAKGGYRGIPNMGWQFHPGYTNGGTTTLQHQSSDRVTLKSVANGFECTWDFYATHAKMTVLKHTEPYWFLYEGTPGGRMQPSSDYYYVPDVSQGDGVRKNAASQDYGVDLSPEWIAFGDPALSRMFVLCHHTNDGLIDDYYDMGNDGGMTVFGFGRDNDKTEGCWSCMDNVPNVFSIAFLESTSETLTKQFAQDLISGTVVTVAPRGGAEHRLVPHLSTDAGKRPAYSVAGRRAAGSGAIAPGVLLIRRHLDSEHATPVLLLE
jgi:hypothetical protein